MGHLASGKMEIPKRFLKPHPNKRAYRRWKQKVREEACEDEVHVESEPPGEVGGDPCPIVL
jgi:hypothetical protein